MVGEGFDDAAFVDAAAAATLDHAFQFKLEQSQPRDPAVHIFQMRARNCIDGGAGPVRLIGQSEQLSNSRLRESQFAALLDETQPLQMFGPIEAGEDFA